LGFSLPHQLPKYHDGMSDKKNQAKVKKVVSDVKDRINTKKEAIVNKANKLGDIAKNTVNDVKKV